MNSTIWTRNVRRQSAVEHSAAAATAGVRIRTLACAALVLLALSLPGTSAAAPADNLRDFLDVARAAGLDGYATQLEQSVQGMPDDQFRMLAGPALVQATAALRQYLEAENAAHAAGFLPGSSVSTRAMDRHGIDGDPFPVADLYFAACPAYDPDFGTLYGFRVAFTVLKDALIAYQTVGAAAKPACRISVIAIGAGGNASVACTAFDVTDAVLQIALDVAFFTLDSLQACREQRFWSRSETSFKRSEHIEDQISVHDQDMKFKLRDHDERVQQKLREAIAREVRIEAKTDLGLTTQLELAMGRKAIKRPAVFYMDRLDELCDRAQQAIDDLPPMYVLADNAQSYVTNGSALKVTDPKRAADFCTLGFNLATRESPLPR